MPVLVDMFSNTLSLSLSLSFVIIFSFLANDICRIRFFMDLKN